MEGDVQLEVTTMKRILVAVDLSEASELTAIRAAELARAMHAELVAVHVYDPDVLLQTLAESGMAIDQYVDALEHGLIRLFRGEDPAGMWVRTEVVEGHVVSRAILEAAQRFGAEAIVMGTHARTGVMRTILGSVAEDVLRHAAFPVLIVPMRAIVLPVQPAPVHAATAT
jgi:nucleotide-binding universal stress UspA family protein